jgi:hypothetical protein
VVYLLHCAGCSEYRWNAPDYGYICGLIDDFEILAIAPFDGGFAGDYRWWLDSPVLTESKLATYVVDELKSRVDSAYATYADSMNTAFCGHSMGGFGAFHLLIEHSDVGAVAVPIKSGVDLSLPLNANWGGHYFNLDRLLGTDTALHTANWERVNVLKNAHRLVGRGIRLRFYSGLLDFWFSEENTLLHGLLDSLGVVHEYVPLDQDHFGVAPALMREVFEYLDTVFVRGGSPIIEGKGKPARRGMWVPAPGTDTRLMLRETGRGSGPGGIMDLRGQVLRPRHASPGVYLFPAYLF